MNLVLPQSTVSLINGAASNHRHPGLQLDKFSIPGDQQAQKTALDKACGIRGDSNLLVSLSERRKQTLESLPGAVALCCKTTGPLTLHLSRASALENAGICLHPLYGFAYLPGSGLKGMARAYAETVWLPTRYRAMAPQNPEPADEGERQKAAGAWAQIEAVFGWAPSSDRGKDWKPPSIPARAKDDNARVGAIVFHDAWPTAWPPLIVDIVNNHHPDYYQHDDNDHPPGDWENPVPVYFLAVKPETTFTFALSKRRADGADDPLDLARQWLLGALCHVGAGGKTNAGYGAFKPVDGATNPAASPIIPSPSKGEGQGEGDAWATAVQCGVRAEFPCTLELVTPAFLAGAEQYGAAAAEGCDLRPATLRGHLRWWWRTLHAGFLDVKTLRSLEAAIWGDTHSGGAVRVVIENNGVHVAQPYDKRNKANFDQNTKKSDHGIPGSDPQKTTQGLWYASYGMDETNKRRQVLEPRASWSLRLIARPTRFFTNRGDTADPKKDNQGKLIAAEQALEQAKASLWLLCHFGAVGSKARRGFGSLAVDEFDAWTRETCQETARQLRAALGLPNNFNANHAHSPSLQQMLGPVEVTFSWSDAWQVLDQVGFAYQAFAKKYKHNREKMALGLPRRIGNPVQGTFNPAPPVTTNGRHSSPAHIHVARSDGGWLVRAVAFPAAHLPNLNTSTTFLKEFLKDFGNDLQRRAKLSPPPSAPATGSRIQRQQTPPASTGPTLPSAGDRVESILLDEKTKKGGWKARHEPSGLSGPIQNTADVPSDKKPGEKLTLIVASVNQREIAFRFPTPADEQRAQRTRAQRKGGPGGGPPRGRR